MLKVLGSACILGGGMLVRYLHALERRREMDTLSDLLSSLRKMAEEIRMARTPLPALLNHLAAGCGAEVGAFFRTAALSARQGRDFMVDGGKVSRSRGGRRRYCRHPQEVG